MAGFAVLALFTLYSLRLSAGPSCLASWTIWTRTVVLFVRSSSIPAVAYSGVVLLGFPRAVFLCVAVKPKMLRIMAGMAQKDSHAAGVAGILAGFARYAAPRAVFPLLFGSAGRRILAILAEEVQAALVVDNSGMFMVGFARDDALHAVFPELLSGPGCLSSWPVWSRTSGSWRRAENFGFSAVAVRQGH